MPSGSGSSFFAATDGSAGGDGSIDDPWDLATALAHPVAVEAGDTIYLRGGTYDGTFTSTLAGTSSSPITVRSYPGEWAKIDLQPTTASDMFTVQGQFTHFRDIELTNTSTDSSRGGFQLKAGQGNKFINMVIHDLGNNTFGNNGSDQGQEIYGSILYNNGEDGSNLEHHLYTQNESINSPSKVEESIVSNGFAWGMHAYSGGSGLLDGIHMIGSVWFNNGLAQTTGSKRDDILVGGNNGADNILLEENYTWTSTLTTRSTGIGRFGSTNGDVTLINNYFIGEVELSNDWDSVTMTGNTFSSLDDSALTVTSLTETGNTELSSSPTENVVVVRPNDYDGDRAHIIVYNWEGLDAVSVDVGDILENGDEYEVRNAQNFFDEDGPALSGTYSGESLSLPMSAGNSPAQPNGGGLIDSSEMTGTDFNVFVLMPPLGTTVDPAEDNIPTPTPTPTGSSTSLSDPISLTSTTMEASVCQETKPTNAPWLYGAVTRGTTSIEVFFTDADEPYDHYALEYGTAPGNYQWAATDIGGSGTRTYIVESLQPNTTYYFRVRAGNGCATGEWSNELSATTKSRFWGFSGGTLDTETIDVETRERVADVETRERVAEAEPGQDDPEAREQAEDEQLGYAVNIKVVDEAEEPVLGASVTLYSTPRETATNEEGVARFEDVEPGEHRVVIAYDGQTGEQRINILGDTDVEEIDFTIQIKTTSPFLDPWVIAVIASLVLGVVLVSVLLVRSRASRSRIG